MRAKYMSLLSPLREKPLTEKNFRDEEVEQLRRRVRELEDQLEAVKETLTMAAKA